jgi:hypothetical protein
MVGSGSGKVRRGRSKENPEAMAGAASAVKVNARRSDLGEVMMMILCCYRSYIN